MWEIFSAEQRVLICNTFAKLYYMPRKNSTKNFVKKKYTSSAKQKNIVEENWIAGSMVHKNKCFSGTVHGVH